MALKLLKTISILPILDIVHLVVLNVDAYLLYRKNTLISLRSMNLESKIIQTKYLIKQTINEFGLEHVYISYSGGKDSTVLSHIAKQLYPDILHIFANTTNEYPETLQHIRWEKEENNTNLITVIPKDSLWKCLDFKRVVKHMGILCSLSA